MKYKTLIIIAILGCGLFLVKLLSPWSPKDTLQVNVKSILSNIQYLSSDEEFQTLQYRVGGMEGEKKAANYIEKAFKTNGLDVKNQIFNFDEVVNENNNSVKFFINNREKIDTTSSKIISNEKIDGTISGKLINLGKATKKEIELKKNKIQGNFILVKIDKSTDVEYISFLEYSKKIKGIIAYDPNFSVPSEPVIAHKFTMKNSDICGEKITTVTTISKENYNSLVKKLSDSQDMEISEYIKYDTKKEKKYSQNIIATKKCTNRNINTPLIIVGAHYDSVNGPGANDNASGLASLIELSKIVSNKKLNYDVKFVAFGSEEIGILGSKYFISTLNKDDLHRCKLMINIEGSGIGDVFMIGKSIGEGNNLLAQKIACKSAEKNDILYKKVEFFESDHFYFSQVGIPTITFASGEYSSKLKRSIIKTIDSNYHTFSDLNKENIITPKDDDTLNDTYDKIEKSNKSNSNFEKLFTVLLELVDTYNLSIKV